MIDQTKRVLSKEAAKQIAEALSARIPCYRGIAVDDSPQYVYQHDMYGGIDTVIALGSERLYHNQNKSRDQWKSADICIEFRSYKGKRQALATGDDAQIAGAYYFESCKCWLSPRFGMADTLTYYLPQIPITLHFCRYYLEIMLSQPETWERVRGIHRKHDDSDVFIVFWNYKKFTQMYMDTVARTTYGETAPETEETSQP